MPEPPTVNVANVANVATVATAASAGPWAELAALCRDETGERAYLGRLLELWCDAHGAGAAALYVRRADGSHELEGCCGDLDFPAALETGDGGDGKAGAVLSLNLPSGLAGLPLPGGGLLAAPAIVVARAAAGAGEPLLLLLDGAARGAQLRRQLKEQSFQVNYRVVELESLYEVGLAVASTLDREQLSEEILLRAVSLLDAQRGALYLVEGGRYRPKRTFGGEAGPAFGLDDEALCAFLADRGERPAELLPGALHLLGVPIAIEESPRGLLVVGDKESRRGVGPFPPADRRTLALFANQAAIALENARLHLEALEKERLERELDLAAEIQRQILPKGSPQVPGYDLAGWNRPARQVGGDYYDLLPLENGKVAVILGDVSGKGMPAALLVSTLHSALRLLLDRIGVGPELMDRLNRHLVESSLSNKFVTSLVAELDPATGEMTYLNAGHNPALLLRGDDQTVEQLGPGGVPLGLLPNARFSARQVELRPGDLLWVYSDGITEAESVTDEEFGMERLTRCLAENRDRPLGEIMATIDREVTRFAEGLPQRDDQTVVLLRRH